MGGPAVPLRFSGEEGGTEKFETLLEAFDGEKRVMVVTSSEAIKDYGLPAVQKKASEKYATNQFDHSGRVRVFTSDFA